MPTISRSNRRAVRIGMGWKDSWMVARCSAWMSFHLPKYGSSTSSGMIRFTITASTR